MKLQRTRALVAALGLLVAAQAAAAADAWTSVRSQNFFLVGNASEKEIRQVATRLEQFRAAFRQLFAGVNFNSPAPTTVVVFKSDGSYKPFKPLADGKTVSVAGYFQPGPDVNYITLTTERAGGNPYSVIYHEFVHLLVNNSVGKGSVPAWFNEGLAEYYSTFAVEDDRRVHIGRLVDYHLLLLRRQRLMPLAQLFAVDNHSLERGRHDVRSLFYAQSWALVHFLILADEGRRLPQLGRFLELVRQGAPTDDAFRRAFETDPQAMEKELQRYVNSQVFQSRVATFERGLEFDSRMTAAPLTEAEAEAYLGDLLLHTDRPEEAAARLERALRLDPALVTARASLGMTRLRQKRYAEATAELREAAAAAGAQNYLAHYYYAYALSREGVGEGGMATGYAPEKAKQMRESLRKAIHLRPDFPESYYLLAWVNLVTGENLGEGAQLIRRALALAPGNEHYALVLAQLYLREEKFEEARRTAEPLTREGVEPALRATARSVLASIKGYEEQVRSYKAQREAQERETQESAQKGRQPPAPARDEAAAPAREPGKTDDELAAEALSSALAEALRKPRAGETRVRAVLTRIECVPRGGLVFVFRAGARQLRLTSAGFDGLHIIAYTPDAGGELACGARKTETTAVVTYRPSADARSRSDGALVALEFVPADFQLK
ncbi:MAG TPA: tetratricopeptide repeat protein [Pyrinomonadaceae bacterium]|jgi:tetratricopeptide (TPR) repeat protein